MDGLWQDLRYAVRLLRRSPRNSFIAVTILALGIGANTAMFSAVNHVLLLPLPFPDSARLMRLRDAAITADGQLHAFNMSARDLMVVRDSADLFDGVIGFSSASMTLIGGDRPTRVSAVRQTDGMDRTLGAQPVLGRGFTDEELRRGAASGVAIISDSLWRTRFGASPAALGAAFRLDDQPFKIIGIMAPLYAFPYEAQVWIPTILDPENRNQEFAVFTHLRHGVTPAQVRAALPGLAARVRQRYPDTVSTFSFELMTMQENLSGNQTGTLRALTTIVGFLLLTACINVATLLLARSVARRREFAVRAVLGAGQARHLRQLLAESVVLAALGCAGGLLIAEWLSTFTATLIPSVLSTQLGLATLHTDWRVASFAVAVSMISALMAAIVPAFGSWRANPRAALADGGRTATSGHGGRVLAVMVIAQTAVTLVLLAGAGLMIQNFLRLRSQALGFDRRGLAKLELTPAAGAYPPGPRRAALMRRVVEEASTVPGISAAITTVNPLGGGTWISQVITEEAAARDARAILTVNIRLITPGLFQAMGIPLLRGRTFTDADREETEPVAIISQQMAQRFWPGEDAIGKRIRSTRRIDEWVTVVGIVGNVSDSHDPGIPLETWYRPYAQQAASSAADSVYLMVRAADPIAAVPAIEQAIWRIDKTLAPYGAAAMDTYYSESIVRERLGAGFMLGFAGFGLALAALGVYGVMAFSVAQRTAEIGIRIALGGQPRDILPLVLRRGLILIASGVGCGIVASIVLNRVLASFLTEIGSLDRLVLAGASVLIGAAACLACVVPAVGASRLDPVVALKAE